MAKLKLNSIKLLGDVFEGLIGAIFVDTDMNYIKTKEIIMGFMESFIKYFTDIENVKATANFKYREYL